MTTTKLTYRSIQARPVLLPLALPIVSRVGLFEEWPPIAIDLDTVETNIVIFDVRAGDALAVLDALKAEGVLMVPFGPATIRATTHRDVSMNDIEHTLATMQKLYGKVVSA